MCPRSKLYSRSTSDYDKISKQPTILCHPWLGCWIYPKTALEILGWINGFLICPKTSIMRALVSILLYQLPSDNTHELHGTQGMGPDTQAM